MVYVVIAGIKMGKVAKVNVVQTPGSYRIPPPKKTVSTPVTPGKSPLRRTKKAGPGRPMVKKSRKVRKPLKERAGYTEEDMAEAVRLV